MKSNINKRRSATLVVMLMCLLLLVGCKKKPSDSEATYKPTDAPEVTQTVVPSNEPEDSETPETVEPTKSSEVKEKDMVIYTINDETLEKEQETVSVPEDSKMTAEFVLDVVAKSLSDHSIDIGINDVSQDGDTVIVDFKQGYAPIYNVGAGIESNLLDCISMSLLDNAEGCKKVIFRVEGKAYESGHIVLEYNEVYKWK